VLIQPAGHDGDNLSGGRVWCLDSQIQHKVQLLKDHVMAPGKPPAVVLAHSIGSYMMLQVAAGRAPTCGMDAHGQTAACLQCLQ
jgi:hypothetical protein